MVVTAITSLSEFKKLTASGKPVVIDFWATWCGPCRAISPLFEKLSEDADYKDVEFYKVDVDEQQEVAQECGIRSMPTFILFNDGDKVEDFSGASPNQLVSLLKQGQALV